MGGLVWSGSEAVLPAHIFGMVLGNGAGRYGRQRPDMACGTSGGTDYSSCEKHGYTAVVSAPRSTILSKSGADLGLVSRVKKQGKELVPKGKAGLPNSDGCMNRLDKLKLISHRSLYLHIDIDACTRRGVLVL